MSQAIMISFSLTLWDAVQFVVSVLSIASVILAGLPKRTYLPWYLLIVAHLIFIVVSISLSLDGFYLLNLGMIAAGSRNIILMRRAVYSNSPGAAGHRLQPGRVEHNGAHSQSSFNSGYNQSQG